MANAAHALKLTTGTVDAWNAWRNDDGIAHVDLSGMDLRGAILDGADFTRADLTDTDLRGAGLRGASLVEARLIRTRLDYTTLIDVRVGGTIFGDVDLATVLGLGTVSHGGPSTIGLDTIERSQGRIPETFLRDIGCTEAAIKRARAVSATDPKEDVPRAEDGRPLNEAERALLAAGLVKRFPAAPTEEDIRRFRSWRPVVIEGPPVSETIIKERR